MSQPGPPIAPSSEADALRNIPVVQTSSHENVRPRKIHLNPKFFPQAIRNIPPPPTPDNKFHIQPNQFELGQYNNGQFPHQYPPHSAGSVHSFHHHHHPPPMFQPVTPWASENNRPPSTYMLHQPRSRLPFQSNNIYRPRTPQEHYFTGFNSQSRNPWLQPEQVPFSGGWNDQPQSLQPVPGPSYHSAFNEPSGAPVPLVGASYYGSSSDFDLFNSSHNDDRFSGRTRRSRSRSSYSSSTRRTPSTRSRRSRSLSSHYRRTRSRSWSSEFSRSSSSELNDRESVLNSDYEINSDSDLDLSKPLSLLSEAVSDSKMLLKDAFKCLGSSKLRSMMPIECKNYSKRRLFDLFKNILDNIDNEKLIRIMEGEIFHTPSPSTSGLTDVENSDDTADSEAVSSSESDVECKKSLRKKSKKKKKKRKKSKRQQSSEAEEESENEVVEPDPPTFPNNLLSSSYPATSVTQQSLLELIHIEYKAKAINVMLKNLGVASDITTLVSNALTAEGNIAVQMLATLQSSNINDVVRKIGTVTSPVSVATSTVLLDTPKPSASTTHESNKSLLLENFMPEKTAESSNTVVSDFNTSMESNTADSNKDLASSPSVSNVESNVLGVDKRSTMIESDSELLNEMDSDVLDLRVGASDRLNLPEDV